MSVSRKILGAGLAAIVLAGAFGGFATPAKADGWREREWREHHRREEYYRYHRYGGQYYYGNRVYSAPPVVYGPPPYSPGINLMFNVR